MTAGLSAARGIMARWGKHQNFQLSLLVSFLAARWWPATTAAPARVTRRSSWRPLSRRSTSAPSPLTARTPGAANEQLNEVFKALDPAKPAVESGELTLESGTATVPLNYSWKIGSGEWKYTTSAELKKSGDKWLTVWNPATLVPGLAGGEILGTLSQSPSRAEILGAGDAEAGHLPAGRERRHRQTPAGFRRSGGVRHPARPAGGGGPRGLRPAGPGGRPRGLRHRHYPARGRPDHHRRSDRRDSRRPRHPRLPAPGTHPHLRPRPAGHRSRGECRTDREIRRGAQSRGHHGHRRPAAAIRRAAARQQRNPGLRRKGGPHRRGTADLAQRRPPGPLPARDEGGNAAENHAGSQPPAAGRGHPGEGGPGVGHRGAPALQRRRPGRRLRTGQQRLRHRAAGPVRPRFHLQDRGLPGHDPQRHDPGVHGGVPRNPDRRRPDLQERRRLPGRPRWDP